MSNQGIPGDWLAVQEIQTALAAAELVDQDTVILSKKAAKYLAQKISPEEVADMISKAQKGSLITASALLYRVSNISFTAADLHLRKCGFVLDGHHPDFSHDFNLEVKRAFRTIQTAQKQLREAR